MDAELEAIYQEADEVDYIYRDDDEISVDSFNWEKAKPLLKVLIARHEAASYERGHAEGRALAQQEVNHARKLQEMYIQARGTEPTVKILACKHCAQKVANGELIETAPTNSADTGEGATS